MLNMRWGRVTQSPRCRNLRTGGGIARARKPSGVDRIPNDNIQPRLCRRRTASRRKSGIQNNFCHFNAYQHMLFQRHHLDRVYPRCVVPAQMQMGIDQAWHQCHAAPLNTLTTVVVPAASHAGAAYGLNPVS